MPPRNRARQSGCPIAFALDVVGDRWTLLVLRDLVFERKRHFRDFLSAPERIASNILADRLRTLEGEGIVTRRADPENARQAIYELTEKGIELIPVLLELIRWGAKHDPKTAAPRPFTRRLEQDRQRVLDEVTAALRKAKP
jgi:DNA-binding HxlR family transcriptional regulator